MPLFAQIQNGVIVADPWSDNVSPGAGWTDVTGQPGTIANGSTLVNGTWVAPPPSVPAEVPAANAKIALSMSPSPVNAGKTLLDDANAAIAAAGGVAAILWSSATTFSRADPFIAQMAATLNLSSAQVDALFIAANSVQI